LNFVSIRPGSFVVPALSLLQFRFAYHSLFATVVEGIMPMPRRATRAIHNPSPAPDRAIAFPIYQTAAFAAPDSDGFAQINDYGSEAFFYTRYDNPTLRNVETKLAALEHAEAALTFASGMTVITTTLMGLLRAGDTIAASRTLYGGTVTFLRDYAPRYGIHVKLLDEADLYEVEKHVPQAKVVYFETPTNPRCDCLSIRKVVAAAKRIGALVVKDNTFASPINQNPLDLGVDLVLHSATKYLGGHSDLTAGAVMGSRERLAGLFGARKVFGGILSPNDAFLLDRSLKTLELRMQQHNRSAQALAEHFAHHPKVQAVYYPGLPSTPGHAVAAEQMTGFGGMMCIALADLQAARTLCDGLKIGMNVAHLGSAETLVSIPVLTSHSMLSADELAGAGLSAGMVRISVGLEDTDDLIADFDQALSRL